jgi:alpha-acetolactate decarboxylase
MRKSIVVLVIMLLPTLFFGQAAFDKFDGQDDVTSVIVNKKMFQMMGSVKMDNKDKETQQYLNLVKKLDNLKVFTTNSTRVTADMKATSEKYMKSAGLEELMRVNDNGKNIKISVRSGSNDSQIKELLMFMEGSSKGNETVLMSLTGDFDLNEISVLTDKMKIPGGDELKKATKSKK